MKLPREMARLRRERESVGQGAKSSVNEGEIGRQQSSTEGNVIE